MPITETLWSVSGLSVELGIDRRALAAQLATLRPDDMRTEKGGKRQIKRWRLQRVLAHLGKNGEASHEAIAKYEEMVCRGVYPFVLSSRYFRGLIINYLREELGISTVDALRAYQAACLGLGYALAESVQMIQDEREEIPPAFLAEVQFLVPACFEELRNLGPAAYAAKYWPGR